MPLVEWAAQVLEACTPYAAALDATHGEVAYSAALASARASLAAPETTPSARILQAMAQQPENGFVGFAAECSARARAALLALPWSPENQAQFEAMAAASWEAQKAIEAADTQSFEDWRLEYMSAQHLG